MNNSWRINDLPAVRVRNDPPTIEEALFAAEGLTDEPDHQVFIASQLMGVAEDEVRKHLKPASAVRRSQADRFDRFDRFERSSERSNDQVFVSSRSGADRAVVVERKSARPQMRMAPSLPSGVVRLNRMR